MHKHRQATLRGLLLSVAALGLAHVPLHAAIQIQSLTPSLSSPQYLGTTVTWRATATTSGTAPLTFQFNVAGPGSASFSTVIDFNMGTFNGGVWSSQPFAWTTIAGEGLYRIQAVAKDFTSGQTFTKTVGYYLATRITGVGAVVATTRNPLIALFSAPACPAGSSMQVLFGPISGAPPTATDWKGCNPSASMNFYIAGMYPNTSYTMNYRVQTGGSMTYGPYALTFTTGALPSNLTFPKFMINTPPNRSADLDQSMILHAMVPSTPLAKAFPVATDLKGRVMWYYAPAALSVLTRPLGETMLGIENGKAWNSFTQVEQLITEYDLAGNIVRQTNTGVIQQQLLALGATNAGPCSAVPVPPPIGAACLGNFSHDLIRLPNGYTAVMATIEKIFAPGTQGSISPLPLDVVGNIVFVLDTNWQAVWYWDAFDHDSGPPELNINRPATMNESCVSLKDFCGPVFLLSSATAPRANEWLHGNSLYYMPGSGDLLVSLRDQDWVIKIDYQNGAGSNKILWRLGPGGDFTFNNIAQDSYPWFTHQHDVGIENNGAGPLTVFDNGNLRVMAQGGGNSRGMAVNVDETKMQVTPVLSQDLGVFSPALGSAQLLSNGNYYFQPGIVNSQYSYHLEVLPMPGTITGALIYDLQSTVEYRSFRMANLYNPPAT